MSNDQNTVSITLLDKIYKVKCPQDKMAELRESAQYLDEKMRELNLDNNKFSSIDRLAVIAALNISHELLMQKRQASSHIDAMNKRIQYLSDKINQSLKDTSTSGAE